MPSRKERLDKLAAHQRFRMNALLVQPGQLIVLSDEDEVHLALRQMEVLVALADRADHFVSKELLLDKVWNNTDQNENVVEKVIAELRSAIGDDKRAPRYIGTGSGSYRMIATIVWEDGRQTCTPSPRWLKRCPYVGLDSYGDAHADVFCGRTLATDELLAAMRKQIDNARRFVFVVGASGCGKTSLLRAGILPKLRHAGVDGMRALSVAYCNLAKTQGGDVIEVLASALASWSLDNRPVFAQQPAIDLAEQLIRRTNTIDVSIGEAFARHADRKSSASPRAHFLLVVDHAETLVASMAVSQEERDDFSSVIDALCRVPRILVVMLARSDFPKLIESMPDLAERQSGEGHVHVLGPRRGEIGEIIRQPAEIAGLDFDFDPQSRMTLDQVLRDAAIEHPDALPLLQHTLQSLYERGADNRLLTFAAYRDIGELEGAIAHRAEEVYGQLPESAQGSLNSVLSQLIEAQPDQDAIRARRSPYTSLPDTDSRALVDAFIDARLFVGEPHEGQPCFGVIHEALLRQWPRARNWAENNRLLLQARSRLRASADRWAKEGQQKDHLLNPGRPLAEALEASIAATPPLSEDEQAFLTLSNRQRIRAIRIRASMIVGLCVLSLMAVISASLAIMSRSEAVRERGRSSDLNAYVIGELAEQLDVKADMVLIESVTSKVLGYCRNLNESSASTNDLVACSRASRKLGEVRMDQSNLKDAQSLIERAVALSERAVAHAPASKVALNEAGQAYAWLGKLRDRQNNAVAAKDAWKSYLRFTELLIRYHPNDPESHIQKSHALNNLGHIEIATGNQGIAQHLFAQSVALKRQVIGSMQRDPLLRYELAVTSSFISSIQAKTGDLHDAEKGYLRQIGSIRLLLDENPNARDWELQLANLLQLHADVSYDLGEIDTARKSISEAIERLTSLCADQPLNSTWARYLAQAHLLASDIAKHSSRDTDSISHLDSALESIKIDESSPEAWKRIHAMAAFKRAIAATGAGSERGMDHAIQAMRDLVRIGNNRHSRMALAEMLLFRLERERSFGNRRPDEDFADEALRTILAINDKSEDIKITALKIRADIAKDPQRPDCKIIRRMAHFGYRNSAYIRSISDYRDICKPI